MTGVCMLCCHTSLLLLSSGKEGQKGYTNLRETRTCLFCLSNKYLAKVSSSTMIFSLFGTQFTCMAVNITLLIYYVHKMREKGQSSFEVSSILPIGRDCSPSESRGLSKEDVFCCTNFEALQSSLFISDMQIHSIIFFFFLIFVYCTFSHCTPPYIMVLT